MNKNIKMKKFELLTERVGSGMWHLPFIPRVDTSANLLQASSRVPGEAINLAWGTDQRLEGGKMRKNPLF